MALHRQDSRWGFGLRNSDGGWLPGRFACGCGCRRGRSGSCGAAAAASARAWCAWQRVIGCCTVMRACATGHRSRASGRVISIPGSRRSSSPDSGIERVQRSRPRRAPRGPAANSGKASGHTRGPRPAPIQSMITGAGRRAGRRPAVSGRRGSAPRAGRCRRRRRPGCRRARRRKDRSGRRGEAPRRFRAAGGAEPVPAAAGRQVWCGPGRQPGGQPGPPGRDEARTGSRRRLGVPGDEQVPAAPGRQHRTVARAAPGRERRARQTGQNASGSIHRRGRSCRPPSTVPMSARLRCSACATAASTAWS